MVDSGTESPRAGTREATGRSWHAEGFPWMSSVFSWLAGAAFLAIVPPLVLPWLDQLVPGFAIVGLPVPPGLTIPAILQALAVSGVFTVLSLTATMAQFRRRWSDRAVALIAYPVAWVAVLPSALVELDLWMAWFAIGTLAAFAFGIHWRIFTWTREVLD
ncbi:hypothetical protein [Aquisphaera insulae]|uniref:hypothetical protein n=1 Tax=Aquisphaera insulae TaxID=2712864 RepID=UPI0013EE0A54|nr:hypothetical protein [Aquisphaera insulae]